MAPNRICIIGPGSAGKSTMAHRLARLLDLPVHHLDQYHHMPGSWVKRPGDEYLALHDAAIAEDKWIIEGNYTNSMPQRFACADLIIEIKRNRFGSLWGYIRRWYRQKNNTEPRIGQPEKVDDKFSFNMVWWLVEPKFLNASRRKKHRKQQALLNEHQHKTVVLKSFNQIDEFVSLFKSR